jgi:hypothetical protein
LGISRTPIDLLVAVRQPAFSRKARAVQQKENPKGASPERSQKAGRHGLTVRNDAGKPADPSGEVGPGFANGATRERSPVGPVARRQNRTTEPYGNAGWTLVCAARRLVDVPTGSNREDNHRPTSSAEPPRAAAGFGRAGRRGAHRFGDGGGSGPSPSEPRLISVQTASPISSATATAAALAARR